MHTGKWWAGVYRNVARKPHERSFPAIRFFAVAPIVAPSAARNRLGGRFKRRPDAEAAFAGEGVTVNTYVDTGLAGGIASYSAGLSAICMNRARRQRPRGP